MEKKCSFCLNEYDSKHKALCEINGEFPLKSEITHDEVDGSPLLSISIPKTYLEGVFIYILNIALCAEENLKGRKK